MLSLSCRSPEAGAAGRSFDLCYPTTLVFRLWEGKLPQRTPRAVRTFGLRNRHLKFLKRKVRA